MVLAPRTELTLAEYFVRKLKLENGDFQAWATGHIDAEHPCMRAMTWSPQLGQFVQALPCQRYLFDAYRAPCLLCRAANAQDCTAIFPEPMDILYYAARYVTAVIRQPPKLTIPRVEFVLDENDNYNAVQVRTPRSCLKNVAERVPTPAPVAKPGPRL